MVINEGKDFLARQKMNFRSTLSGLTGNGHGAGDNTALEPKGVNFIFFVNGKSQPVRQRIHNRYANTMKATGNFVAVPIKLSASV